MPADGAGKLSQRGRPAQNRSLFQARTSFEATVESALS